MGRVHGESEEGLRIVYSMKAILVFSLVTVAMSAPQYGGGSSQPVKAPVQSASVQCTTEYVEVWDTNYVETESQQCQLCRRNNATQLTRNSVCLINVKNVRLCINLCATLSTRRFAIKNIEMRQNTTQRQSVIQTTSKTVNTNGKALVITRSGHQYKEPARKMHMTNVKMCRSRG